MNHHTLAVNPIISHLVIYINIRFWSDENTAYRVLKSRNTYQGLHSFRISIGHLVSQLLGKSNFHVVIIEKEKKTQGITFFSFGQGFPNRPSCTADVRKFKNRLFAMRAACENLLHHTARALVSQSHSECCVMCLSQIWNCYSSVISASSTPTIVMSEYLQIFFLFHLY